MRILLSEDEVQMANVETAFLKLHGFEVDNAYTGNEAVQKAETNAYDVIVLDIMMPEKDGIQALREIRASGNTTPVIMLTAKAEIDDRIDGLSAGADDYLTKPFAMKELEARLRAQIRRADQFSPGTLIYGDVMLNIGEQELSGKSSIRLSGKETRLMEYLLRNAERDLLSKDIFEHVWKDSSNYSEEMIALYISYLQGKLQAVSSNVSIRVNGVYCLCQEGGSPE